MSEDIIKEVKEMDFENRMLGCGLYSSGSDQVQCCHGRGYFHLIYQPNALTIHDIIIAALLHVSA
jgi:hypothetical protein